MKKLVTIILPLLYLGHANDSKAADVLDKSTQNLIRGIIDPTPNIFGSKIWDLDSPFVVEQSENFQNMGEAVASGDFNNDGYQDLAVGIPGYDFFNLNAAGTVVILYGTANGLSGNNSQLLFQTLTTNPSNLENDNGVEANDRFGEVLASGDFNCDGFADLAVGTPKEDITFVGDGGVSRDNVGAVNIFYGNANGFSDNGQGSTFLVQGIGTGSTLTSVSAGDQFGFALAAGNFNNDYDSGINCWDLAVSAPYENFGNNDSTVNAGQVEVYYGSTTGIDASDREIISQNSFNVDDSSEDNDLFGYSLAAGRLNSLPAGAFLAVGVPGESGGGLTQAGIVQVFFNAGDAGLMASVNDEIWSQDSPGILGISESGDQFGYSLAIGNFDNAGSDDLAIGVYGEDLNADGITDAGAVNVIYSTLFGFSSTGNQLFYQGNNGLQGDPQNFDRFSQSLTAGDLNYDGIEDLVIGVPSKSVSAGAFHVIYGNASRLSTVNDDYFINGTGGDILSTSLSIGDFGNGPELAAGLTGYNSADADNNSGAVQVFEFVNPDVIFKDDFED